MIVGSKYNRLIYSFEFPDKSVYVGLTYNPKQRMNRHLVDCKSQVYKHMIKTGFEPIFKILSPFVYKDFAIVKEGKCLNKYKNDGWKILNVSKTGGLGGDTLIWTKEKCIEEAKKYKHKSDFARNSKGAYDSAYNNNWLKDCYVHMIEKYKHKKYWCLETCKKEALKFNNKNEWKKKSNYSYNIARINSWLNTCSEHMIRPQSYKKISPNGNKNLISR